MGIYEKLSNERLTDQLNPVSQPPPQGMIYIHIENRFSGRAVLFVIFTPP